MRPRGPGSPSTLHNEDFRRPVGFQGVTAWRSPAGHDGPVSQGPTPGWYPDPEGTGQLRWWDGQQWTATYRPTIAQALPPAPTDWAGSGRYRPINGWFTHIFGLLGDRIGHLFTIAAVTLLPFTVVFFVSMWQALDGVDVTIVDDDIEVIGWTTGATTALVVGALAMVFGSLWFTTAGQHQLWASAVGHPSSWSRSIIRGLVYLPRLVGWSLVISAGLGVAVAIVVLAGLVVAPALAVLLGLVLVAGLVWIMVHLQFLMVSVVSSRSNALTAAFGIARGRWMATFGRTLLTWMVAAAASLAFAFVGQIVSVIGGAGSGGAVESVGGVDTIHLGDLYPNVGAAIVFGIVTALQSGASQAVTMASLASMYVDAGGPSDPSLAGYGSESGPARAPIA